jgi:hypothetical protein
MVRPRLYGAHAGTGTQQHLPNRPKGHSMNTKTTAALRIALALALLAALVVVLPVLGMVGLALLALVVPMLLVLTPVLVPLALVFLVDRLRDPRGPAGVPATQPATIGTPALQAPAR